MTRLISLILFTVVLGTTHRDLQAQCKMLTVGLNTRSESSGCAPFTLDIENLFNNVTEGTEFVVDWGDGNVEVLISTASNLRPDFIHVYEANELECGYTYTIEATNGCTMPGDAQYESTVSVWDTDQQGLSIGPQTVRVCQNATAEVTFEDLSDWNCFPRDEYQNFPPRYIQWVYNSNAGSGIELAPYGSNSVSGPVLDVFSTGELSDLISIPSTDPSNPGNPFPIGASFEITLNNWNQCNPPGMDPVTTTANIVIVGEPSADFTSSKWDYCIGDQIELTNLSSGFDGESDLIYSWEFYDGPNDTDDLLEIKTNRNPTIIYSAGGEKLIRLNVRDNNTIGSCQAMVEKVVRITPTAIAQIGTANTSFCKTPGSDETFTVTFTDETVGSIAGVDEWAWELFDENGDPLQRVPASGFNTGSKVTIDQGYSKPGIYKARLTYRDVITKCDTYDEINIVIYNNPEPSFIAAPVCEGLDIELIDETSLDMINGNKVIRWEWDFSYDNITFNAEETYENSRPDTLNRTFSFGQHQVALRTTNDQNGCNAIYTDVVEVYQNPEATFTKDIAEGCSPLLVNFENTSTATQPVNINEYVWCIDYGNGFIDTLSADPGSTNFEPTTTATFENWNTSSKNFYVALKTISDKGCVRISEPDSVKVLPSIKPGFFYTNYEPLAKNCSPIEVNFQVDAPTIALSPQDYTWTVEDENGIIHQETLDGSINQFNRIFTANGNSIHNYSINLQTNISDICAGDSAISLNVNPVPHSEFSIDTVDIDCETITVEVDAAQKGLVEYNWTITKGAMIFMNDTLHDNFTYTMERPAPGNENMYFQVDLTTENYAFCESEKATDHLIVPAQPNLQASFTANPETQVFPNASVNINNLSSHSGAIHHWDFGDGFTSDVIHPAPHKYEGPGHYTINLELKEDFCISIDSVMIYIQPTAPIADFTFDPGSGCVPLTINFTNLTKYGDPESYVWYFGEGESISNTEHPTYTYYEPGTYSVKLEASNDSEVTDIVVKKFIIEAYPNPHAEFSVRPEKVKLPEDPIYTTNLSFEADSYHWDFGDGNKSIEIEPSHIYTDTGQYDITLIAMTNHGCADTVVYENIVEVVDGNEIRIPNAFTPSLDGPNGGNRYSEGRNDVFYPVTEGVIAYHMQIYNRWGELLFDTSDSGKGWDGYYRGKICPPDVYIYKIDFKFIDGKQVMKFGDVALIR